MNLVPFVRRSEEERSTRPTGLPLRALYADFARLVLPRKALSTQRNHQTTRKLSEGLGDYPSVAEIEEWRAWLDRKYPNSGTPHAHTWNLQRVYSWGSQAAKSSGNPVALCEFRPPPKNPRAIRNVARSWPQILAAMPDDRSRAFVAVLRFTGMRKGEALALTRDDVISEGPRTMFLSVTKQREAKDWEVRDLKGKWRSHRTIAVRDELVPFLRKVIGLGPAHVWIGRGGQERIEVPFLFPLRPNDLERHRRALREALPLFFGKGDAWHVLRHSVAAELGDAGRDVSVAQKILGHTSSATTDNYMTALVGKRVGKEVWAGLPKSEKQRPVRRRQPSNRPSQK